MGDLLETRGATKGALGPPPASQGIVHDLSAYLVRRPAPPTLIAVSDPEVREEYTERIRQRLGISVADYAVLNLHRIGIEAPVQLIFEELFTWHDASVWWPNHLACVERQDGSLEHARMLLLGVRRWPLFELDAVRIRRQPGRGDQDNARYALYETKGGYPMGMFGMYVRSRIADRGEGERSQLFFAVGFDFYGKKGWPHRRVINPIWEWLHNRITGNILHRVKRVCEWRFQRIEGGT
ncbi:MAG: hypothetical protein ACYTEZ_07520 [Planctomycetota bacterium]